jgi:hypothetical protein
MRAAKARRAQVSLEDRQRVGPRLRNARLSRVPLIAAKPPPPRVGHPSMEPKACEWCSDENAAPYQRAPLLTCNWG